MSYHGSMRSHGHMRECSVSRRSRPSGLWFVVVGVGLVAVMRSTMFQVKLRVVHIINWLMSTLREE